MQNDFVVIKRVEQHPQQTTGELSISNSSSQSIKDLQLRVSRQDICTIFTFNGSIYKTEGEKEETAQRSVTAFIVSGAWEFHSCRDNDQNHRLVFRERERDKKSVR